MPTPHICLSGQINHRREHFSLKGRDSSPALISATITTSQESTIATPEQAMWAIYGDSPTATVAGGREAAGSLPHILVSVQAWSSSPPRNGRIIPHSWPQTCVLAGGYFAGAWLLEHHGVNITLEPLLSTVLLKVVSMSIFIYCTQRISTVKVVLGDTEWFKAISCFTCKTHKIGWCCHLASCKP